MFLVFSCSRFLSTGRSTEEGVMNIQLDLSPAIKAGILFGSVG